MSFRSRKFHLKEKNIIPISLGVNAIVGMILFVIFVLPRSEPNNQLIFGLSTSRVLIALIFLFLLLFNIGIILLSIFEFGSWQKKLKTKISGLIVRYNIGIIVTLYAVLIFTATFLLLSIPPIIRPLSFLEPFSARLSSIIGWLFFSNLLFIILLRAIMSEEESNSQLIARLDQALTVFGLFIIIFFLYAHFAALIGWVGKTKYSFFDLLAEQFIQGKLYIENPPYTHDLTLYKGNWYAPMPPLPAILMMPLAYFVGAANISTSYLSMVASAINGVLLFLILKELNARKWISLSTRSIFILITLFLFGTPHLWMGISGRGWYFSQILTLLFLALAAYATLRKRSAWLIGALIAIAIMARPTGIMTSSFYFAIAMQIKKEENGEVTLKEAVQWIAKTLPSIGLAIIGLLIYNYLRFENFFDFGYVTVNAGPEIVHNVQTWGTFSAHFIPTNLQVMLFKLPFWNPDGRWLIEPSATGMSIFLTTPALIYLFRRYSKDWWIIGSWTAVFLTVGLLSLYHNTGAHQFGYRYILDFLTPLMVLLAVGFKKKTPWHFQLLVIASIAINLYGAHWFMNG
ncbi:MAG: hypothetical protein HN736_12060 [Anaerolineae bacterium]|jgi:hypothetical protein|nr:hypothetical protein [Anaerolineae bacterium]MBT4312487.1 hypothetical protein [Anaerolineae bacterium]MBT4458745.1 hypothetical protein [Anaerolineae bacterium]MBT4842245.1 hypothetical protein [Anaerolineae bacterium]MBT6062877.1 hypothetical protein [Anaerolineae bacterium]